MIRRLAARIHTIIASEAFFWGVIIFFCISSVWVATSSLYPMAFDEEFHFGLIKIYAGYLLPYGIENTRDMAQYGAAAADPSYLFHYLMSFPYRLLDWFGLSETAIIIMLRLLNVAMVGVSLFIYRKALLAGNVSKAIANGAIAAFTLIPILPMMAGQLNYDNLLLVMVAISFWLLIRVTQHVATKKVIPLTDTLMLIGVLLVTLPVKYAYLPIALGMALWLAWLFFKVIRKQGFHSFGADLLKSARTISLPMRIGLIVLFSAGIFFSARYVENYIRYDSPIPSCSSVHDTTACLAYGPWARDYAYKNNLDPTFIPISFPAYFVTEWLPDMMMRLTFAVAGKTNNFQTKQPLPLVWPIASIFVAVGLGLLITTYKSLIKKWPYVSAVVVVTAVYVGSLSFKLYNAYAETSVPVAINGRYLLPLLPLFIAVLAQATLYAAAKFHIREYATAVLALLLIIVFLQGGGVFTYIVLGEQHWFYPGWGQTTHDILQHILSPITWQHRWFQ